MRFKPYDLLSVSQKEKFKTEREYLDFLGDIALPDMKSKKTYLKDHKEKVEEGAEWLKEYQKFYKENSEGIDFIWSIKDKKIFKVRPEFMAYSMVRSTMLNRLYKSTARQSPTNPNHTHYGKITQAQSNHLTRRAKVSYLVFMGKLTVKDNILFDKQSVPQKVVSFNEAIKLFDKLYIISKGFTYPRELGTMTEHLLKNVMGYN